MAASKILLLLFAVAGFVGAYKLDLCTKKPPVKTDYEIEKLEGDWYEYAHYPNIFQYFYQYKCNAQNIQKNGTQISLRYSFSNVTSGEKVNLDGSLTADAAYPGSIVVKLPSVDFEGGLTVVDVDYGKYLVLYSCETMWYFRIEMAWVLTRYRTLSPEQGEELTKKLASLNIDTERLAYVDQKDC